MQYIIFFDFCQNTKIPAKEADIHKNYLNVISCSQRPHAITFVSTKLTIA